MLGFSLVLMSGSAHAEEASVAPPPSPIAAPSAEAQEASLTRAFSRIEWHTLDNGMLVVLDPQEGTPTVTLAIGVAAGRRDEPEGWNGIAHVAEHALFREGASGEASIRARMEALGAVNVRSRTSADDTRFWETVSSSALDALLWLEADRFVHAYSMLNEEHVRHARNEVESERAAAEFGAMVAPAVLHRFLYAGHPYAESRAEHEDDAGAVGLSELQAFMQRSYTPERMTLSLSGGFDPQRVLPRIRELFGVMRPNATPIERAQPEVPVLHAERRILINVPTPQDGLVVVWPTAAYGAPGDAELDLVADVLAERLRAMFAELRLNVTLRVRQVSRHLSSEFTVFVQLPRDVGTMLPLRAVTGALARLANEPVGDVELADARQNVLERYHARWDSTETRAQRLVAHPQAFPDGHYDPRFDAMRYSRLNAADVQEAVRSWLPPDGRLVVTLDATQGAPCEGEIVRELSVQP